MRSASGIEAAGERHHSLLHVHMLDSNNLDENGAAIRIRANGRDVRMIALSLGRCKPFLTVPSYDCRVSFATGPGKLQVRHIRNARKLEGQNGARCAERMCASACAKLGSYGKPS
jgi:hypothetical protein